MTVSWSSTFAFMRGKLCRNRVGGNRVGLSARDRVSSVEMHRFSLFSSVKVTNFIRFRSIFHCLYCLFPVEKLRW